MDFQEAVAPTSPAHAIKGVHELFAHASLPENDNGGHVQEILPHDRQLQRTQCRPTVATAGEQQPNGRSAYLPSINQHHKAKRFPLDTAAAFLARDPDSRWNLETGQGEP